MLDSQRGRLHHIACAVSMYNIPSDIIQCISHSFPATSRDWRETRENGIDLVGENSSPILRKAEEFQLLKVTRAATCVESPKFCIYYTMSHDGMELAHETDDQASYIYMYNSASQPASQQESYIIYSRPALWLAHL